MAAFTLPEDEMKAYLAEVHICKKHGHGEGGGGGEGPPTSLLAMAGRRNGKDLFHVPGCSSVVAED